MLVTKVIVLLQLVDYLPDCENGIVLSGGRKNRAIIRVHLGS